jgi:hypothetical protein
MPTPDEPAFDSADFDPAAMLWTPGIEYVHGWREATDAAAALLDALTAVGIDTSTITARADASPDGVGLLRLTLPAATARQLTTLAKVAATHIRQAG